MYTYIIFPVALYFPLVMYNYMCKYRDTLHCSYSIRTSYTQKAHIFKGYFNIVKNKHNLDSIIRLMYAYIKNTTLDKLDVSFDDQHIRIKKTLSSVDYSEENFVDEFLENPHINFTLLFDDDIIMRDDESDDCVESVNSSSEEDDCCFDESDDCVESVNSGSEEDDCCFEEDDSANTLESIKRNTDDLLDTSINENSDVINTMINTVFTDIMKNDDDNNAIPKILKQLMMTDMSIPQDLKNPEEKGLSSFLQQMVTNMSNQKDQMPKKNV